MREGTPSGLSTISTGVPFSSNGMSSTGTIIEMTLVAVTTGHLVAGLQACASPPVDLDILSTPGPVRRPLELFFPSVQFEVLQMFSTVASTVF